MLDSAPFFCPAGLFAFQIDDEKERDRLSVLTTSIDDIGKAVKSLVHNLGQYQIIRAEEIDDQRRFASLNTAGRLNERFEDRHRYLAAWDARETSILNVASMSAITAFNIKQNINNAKQAFLSSKLLQSLLNDSAFEDILIRLNALSPSLEVVRNVAAHRADANKSFENKNRFSKKRSGDYDVNGVKISSGKITFGGPIIVRDDNSLVLAGTAFNKYAEFKLSRETVCGFGDISCSLADVMFPLFRHFYVLDRTRRGLNPEQNLDLHIAHMKAQTIKQIDLNYPHMVSDRYHVDY